MQILQNNSFKNWPFIEAQKIFNKKILPFLDKINNAQNNNHDAIVTINFETGYGPSGLPHIGTFCEVFRTTLIITALKTLILQNNIDSKFIKIRLICFSDDLDGLKKVPSNIPNQELIAKYIGQPLTSVPDAFLEKASYGEYMNSKLISFLDAFGMEYEFVSATKLYKTGFFNEALKTVMHNYDALMKIMLPTLGEERQKTYSPFLPICKKTNKVLQAKVIKLDKEKYEITYLNEDGTESTTSILNGEVKLQWKVDFAMRWMFLPVDYEMYGKDHQSNHTIYSDLCKALGGTPPMQFFYELFLDFDGNKISKSKGNSISIDEWLSYAPIESLGLYVMHAPERAKRLFFDIIPKATDEYIAKNIAFHQKKNEFLFKLEQINEYSKILTDYNHESLKNLNHVVNLFCSKMQLNSTEANDNSAKDNPKANDNSAKDNTNLNDKLTEESFNLNDEIENVNKILLSLLDDSIWLMHNTIFSKDKILGINNVPKIEMHGLTFTLLLNLASACNPENKDIMWGFIKKYAPDCAVDNTFLNKLIDSSILYYKNFIKPNKQYLLPDEQYAKILSDMKKTLKELDITSDSDKLTENDIQNAMFAVGKRYYEPKDLRTFFSTIYQILLGQTEGPRLGSFIALFGINNVVNLIEEKLHNINK
ncbi:MAG: lysine--tRNA ligase [Rickettsiales bacterium]